MRRQTIFVVLAGLAAMVASIMVYSALKSREAAVLQAAAKNVQVVVAAYDLPLGTKIEPGEVKTTRWSSDSIPEGAYTDTRQIIGSFVKSAFVANEPIVASKLFLGEKTAGVMPLLIPFGMRAVSVPVDEVSDIAGFVLPHTRVDVLVALSGGDAQGKPFSKVVLQNVEVLAVAQEVEKKKDEPTPVKVVTLLVTPQEAERVSLASREGTLRLAMRNYNDNKIVLTSGTDVAQMLRAYSLAPEVPVMSAQPAAHKAEIAPRPRPRPFQIEILRNGHSSESISFINEGAKSDGHAKAAHNADAEDSTDKSPAPADNDEAEAAPAAIPVSAPVTAADIKNPLPGMPGVEASAKPASADHSDSGDAPKPKTIELP